MIVYRDILSGDEMMSDAFKMIPVMDEEGAVVSRKTANRYSQTYRNWNAKENRSNYYYFILLLFLTIFLSIFQIIYYNRLKA